MTPIRSESLIDDQWKNDPNFVSWYIIFEPRPKQYWFDRFMDMRFGHVSALRWDGFNWIMVIPYSGYTRVEILPYSLESHFKSIVGSRRYIKVETIVDAWRLRIPWILSTSYCVDEIKALLGIRNFFIITPKQLYYYLLNYGRTRPTDTPKSS